MLPMRGARDARGAVKGSLVMTTHWPINLQVASRIVEAAQAAGASQLVLVSPSGAGGGGGLFGGFLGGGGGLNSAVEEACDPAELSWHLSVMWQSGTVPLASGNLPSRTRHAVHQEPVDAQPSISGDSGTG